MPEPTAGQFAGQFVLVTGAGSGIGRATAAAFAAAGAQVLGDRPPGKRSRRCRAAPGGLPRCGHWRGDARGSSDQ